ncbi:unnamed protein product [Leptosia nina]|uniref:TAFII55 protein conserved region domain-containing protein n=1 Tax=Leptosia nina TaxID=320188 RepID=A0AAV1JZR5_9NEOP
MNKDKREIEYPAELESQFILRLPEEPTKVLKDVLKTGENLKNRLTIQIDNDMRHGEVRLDHWLMHAKIVDIPTIIESLKTIDNKSFYKTADICQMMICKTEPDQPADEEAPTKNKKKDPYKVEKKFLWPHGVTPPTKNVRKRRFRKTLKKKCVEGPEIEKEVKRLLRADNEAVNITWEVIKDDDEHIKPESSRSNVKQERKPKERTKKEIKKEANTKPTSNVVDIFGGALSDSDIEDENVNVDVDDSHMSYDTRLSDNSVMLGLDTKKRTLPIEFQSEMFQAAPVAHASSSMVDNKPEQYSDEEDFASHDESKENMSVRIEQLGAELEEMKQRRVRTQNEIASMENLALRQRFQDTLHTLNQDIMFKEMEYQGLITLQNSDDI